MCEKNFEGKILSSPSNNENDINEDDINEETIVDNDVKTDVDDAEIVKPPKKKKRSYKRRSKIKKNICKTCNQDILEMEKRKVFMYNDTYHQLRAKEYCKDHEISHSDHKCKPHWCGDCGYLVKYDIMIDWDKKAKGW